MPGNLARGIGERSIVIWVLMDRLNCRSVDAAAAQKISAANHTNELALLSYQQAGTNTCIIKFIRRPSPKQPVLFAVS